MKQYLAATLVVLGTALLASAGQTDKGETGSTVKVMCHYKGTGTVDDSHKIYISLWSTPDFVQPGSQAVPVDTKPLSSKTGTVVFSGVTASPVYVTAGYDPKGAWDAHSAPPAGTSLGLYSEGSGKPKAVEVKTSEAATIHLAFDDSQKMH